jgi:NAD(P) transhydrogenase
MPSVGLSEAEAIAKHGHAIVGRAKCSELARGHINGDGAAELIHVAQMAIAAGQDVDVFVDNVFNFPTFAEAYLVAALDVLGQRHCLARAA